MGKTCLGRKMRFKKIRAKLFELKTRNPVLDFRIRKAQNLLLKRNYNENNSNLIIFLTLGYDTICGGILSISSLFSETEKLKSIHKSNVIMCTVPGEPLLLKYTKFKNEDHIFEFSKVINYFKNIKNLIIHVPEEYTGQFLYSMTPTDLLQLKKVENLHINIMIQNIELALNHLDDIIQISKTFKNVTSTTAHEKYSNEKMEKKFDIQIHKLSVFISPEQYDRINYNQKKNKMIVSPDFHPKKTEILTLIKNEIPNLEIKIIKNLTYEEFKNEAKEAKWALTFGEGLDGYFIETIFSGGISFSVYNSDFFTEDFKSLKTIYADYDELKSKIISDINKLDKKESYLHYQSELYNICSKYYNYQEYIDNLKLFYKKYTNN